MSCPDRHGQHGAQALRNDVQGGLKWCLVEYLLEIAWQQQDRAEKCGSEDEHPGIRDGHHPVLEQPQIDQRVIGPQQRARHESGDGSTSPTACRCPDVRVGHAAAFRQTTSRRGRLARPGDSSAIPMKSNGSDGEGRSLAKMTRRKHRPTRSPIGTLIRKIHCHPWRR